MRTFKSRSLVASVTVLFLCCLFALPSVHAVSPAVADPYADAVDSSSGLSNANNALGAPDNNFVSGILGPLTLNWSLTLDMGAGEEGNSSLIIHHGSLSANLATTVEFLNSSKSVIESHAITVNASVGAGTTTVPFTTPSQPYRYVKLSGLVGVLSVDAVEATTAAAASAYANAVDSSSNVGNPNNAIGAPDSAFISGIGPVNAAWSITLDMGAGEEGTGPLIIYDGALAANIIATVDFLDGSKQVIESHSITAGINVGASSISVPFNSASKPYRFVTISGIASVLPIDAVEATASSPQAPYANAVDSSTNIGNAANAIGAPDNAYISSVGPANTFWSITLDMGQGEEGSGSLLIYQGQIAANTAATVDFLDANKQIIETRNIVANVTVGANTLSVPYTSAPQKYRYVRISGLAGVLPIDAVAATNGGAGDPYANAVDSSSSTNSTSNALGAPDGNYISGVSLLWSVTLDMGAGEEGTGALIIHNGPLAVNLAATVDFLDAAKQVIESHNITVNANVGNSTTTVPFTNRTNPYRFVKISGVAGVLAVDAIEASTYRPDSDGDGLPDTWEIQYQFDPFDNTGVNGASGNPDNDGLNNLQEYIAGTNPRDPDSDHDGLPDDWEVFYSLNPNSSVGINGATGDPDGDGLTNIREYQLGTNPRNPDTDGDGLPDGWEVLYGLDPLNPNGDNGANGDPDHDGVTNIDEYHNGTSPNGQDTDNDGLPDAWETQYGLNPNDATGDNGASGDPDHDGLTNIREFQLGTDPTNPDTDGDGLPDGWEVAYGLDPLDPNGDNGANGDPDHDGVTNIDEYNGGTDPSVINGTARVYRLLLPVVLACGNQTVAGCR